MPAVSKAQYNFMQGVAHGGIKAKGLSHKQAAEYVAGQSSKGLPKKVKKKKKTGVFDNL